MSQFLREYQLPKYKRARANLIKRFDGHRQMIEIDDLDEISRKRLECLDLLIVSLPEPIDLKSAVALRDQVNEMMEIAGRLYENQEVLTTGTEVNEKISYKIYVLLYRTYSTIRRGL